MSISAAYGFLGRLGSEPQLLAPHYTASGAVLRQMMSVADGSAVERAFMSDMAGAWGADVPERRPYAMADGIAIIPVHGMLLNRFSGAWGFVTGYDYIRTAFDAALADSSVRGIVFDVDSHGGEVHGCFELADHIKANRGAKPTQAIVNASCYSAAYALASAASRITITPSGAAGSIGVVAMHVDYSKALEADGIAITFIYRGDHKVDGNSYEPLPADVKADIQARIDVSYERFVGAVAGNRRLSPDKVRATQARCFAADEAKSAGLVDAVAAPKEAFGMFTREISRGKPEYDEMTAPTTDETAARPEDAASAAPPVVEAASAPAADTAAAVQLERERISAILNCEEAKGRSALANHLALHTDMGADAARAVLAAAASEPKAAVSPFEAAMDGSANPGIGSGDAAGAEEGTVESAVKRIIANHQRATGVSLI